MKRLTGRTSWLRHLDPIFAHRERDAPVEQGKKLLADQLKAPPAQRAHVGPLSTAVGPYDRLEVGAGGEQLIGEIGLARAGPHQGLRQRDQGRVPGSGLGGAWTASEWLTGVGDAALDGSEQLLASFAQTALTDAADLFELARGGRPALGYLDQGSVAEHALDGSVAGGGGTLAPGDQLPRDALGGGVHASDAR